MNVVYLADALVVVGRARLIFSLRRWMIERRKFSPTISFCIVIVDRNFLRFGNPAAVFSSLSSSGCKFGLIDAEFKFRLSEFELDWMIVIEEFWREIKREGDIVLCRA